MTRVLRQATRPDRPLSSSRADPLPRPRPAAMVHLRHTPPHGTTPEVHVLTAAHRALSPSRTALAAVGAVAVLIGLAGGAAAVDLRSAAEPTVAQELGAPTPVPRRSDGFDPATCLAPAPAAAPAEPAAPAAAASAQTVVSFVVTARTVITVDGSGRPLAVATNTQQAPCITDTFVRVAPDGTAALADPALRDAVLSVDFGRAWQIGVPEPFPAQ
jgi:hypothetical protein